MAAETPFEIDTRFEIVWDHIVGIFGVVKAIGTSAIQDAASGDYEIALAKMEKAASIAAGVPDLWAVAKKESSACAALSRARDALDEPLLAFAESYAQEVRAAQSHVASTIAGSTSNVGLAVTTALFQKRVVAGRALTATARALTTSLGGDPSRIVDLVTEG